MSPGIFLPTLVFTLGILAIQLMWCIAVPFCQRLCVSAAARVIRARHSPPWRTGPLGAGQFCPDRDTERASIMCAQVLTAFRPASAQVLLVFSAVFLFAIATPGMVHHVASAAWLPIGSRLGLTCSACTRLSLHREMELLDLRCRRLSSAVQGYNCLPKTALRYGGRKPCKHPCAAGHAKPGRRSGQHPIKGGHTQRG